MATTRSVLGTLSPNQAASPRHLINKKLTPKRRISDASKNVTAKGTPHGPSKLKKSVSVAPTTINGIPTTALLFSKLIADKPTAKLAKKSLTYSRKKKFRDNYYLRHLNNVSDESAPSSPCTSVSPMIQYGTPSPLAKYTSLTNDTEAVSVSTPAALQHRKSLARSKKKFQVAGLSKKGAMKNSKKQKVLQNVSKASLKLKLNNLRSANKSLASENEELRLRCAALEEEKSWDWEEISKLKAAIAQHDKANAAEELQKKLTRVSKQHQKETAVLNSKIGKMKIENLELQQTLGEAVSALERLGD